eukprot:811501-Pyramimonas_sp.AAC.1
MIETLIGKKCISGRSSKISGFLITSWLLSAEALSKEKPRCELTKEREEIQWANADAVALSKVLQELSHHSPIITFRLINHHRKRA